MKNQEVINGLFESSEWISEIIVGSINDEGNEHIKYMLKSIDEAIVLLRNNVSVEVLSYEDDGKIEYDIEHMVSDFAEKLNELYPIGIDLDIVYL